LEPAAENLRGPLAQSLFEAGRWEEARAIFEVLAAEDPANWQVQGYLGALAAHRGDRAEAERISTWLARLEAPYLFGRHTYQRARIAALLGEDERAVVLLREALADGLRSLAFQLHRDPDFESLRHYPPFQELARPRG